MYDNVIIGIDGYQGGRDAARLARSLASATAHFTLVYVGTIVPVAHATDLELELADHDDLPGMLGAERLLCGENAEVRRIHAGRLEPV